jgi:hypothetical protein
MKSESKKIKECAKELHFLADKLYLQFCEGELCTKCKLDIKNGECILNRMISVVNTLEKILYGEKNKIMNMDIIAKRIVRRYVEEHLDKSDKEIALTQKEPYFVWKCKTLQNWKYLLSTDLHDGMYYELTYNGDKQEWYLDAYKKFENRCIPMSEAE